MQFFGKLGKPFMTGTGPPPTDDLTVPTRDKLFQYQMYQDNPLALTPESLYVAKILLRYHVKKLGSHWPRHFRDIETHQYANSVFRSCLEAHVINFEGLPDTAHIDSSLVSKIAIISVPKTCELVNMLFFWEEEVTRLRLLDDEIRERSKGGKEEEEMEMVLKAAKEKREVVPSKRMRDGTVVGEGSGDGEEALPAYE